MIIAFDHRQSITFDVFADDRANFVEVYLIIHRYGRTSIHFIHIIDTRQYNNIL